MRNFLYFLGSAVYGAAAAYITYIFFKWFYGFSWGLIGRLQGSAFLYVLVLVVAMVVAYFILLFLSTVVAFPLKLMRNETSIIRYVPTALMLVAGFLPGRLPWLLKPLGFHEILFGVAFDFIVLNFVFGVILFTWKKYDAKKTDTKVTYYTRR